MKKVSREVDRANRMFLSAVREGLRNNLNQVGIGEELSMSKQSVSKKLKKLGYKWTEMKLEFGQSPSSKLVNESAKKKSNFKSSKNAQTLKTEQNGNNHDSNSQSGAKNNQPTLEKYNQINEAMYQEMLLACAKANPSDLRVLAEVRNYLDKTERFTSEKGGFLKTPEEARDIEVKARAILKQIGHKAKT